MSRAGPARAAPAKINLALHITGRRADGYHELDTIAAFADAGECVAVSPAATLDVVIDGPFGSHAPGGPSDLAWRAAEAFLTEAGVSGGATIRVQKHIPAGAGLGGGSADAAAVLAQLDGLFPGRIAPPDLARIALGLGADVPMCLAGRALRARGVGEAIAPLQDWPDLPVVLAWPGQPVATGPCFAALERRDNAPLPAVPAMSDPLDAAAYLGLCRNDLEPPATVILPVIGDVLGALRSDADCLLARMSGSGSACFGLFPTRSAADAAAARLAASQPGWWVRSTVAR